MSEPILMALVQLFAVVSATAGRRNGEKSRILLESYLREHIAASELEEYLKLYDELIFFHTPDDTQDFQAIPGAKVTEMCRKIARDLPYSDRLIIFIRYLEFVGESTPLDIRAEAELLRVPFSITAEDFQGIITFLADPGSTGIRPENLLVIDGGQQQCHLPESLIHHICRERLEGRILIHLIPSERMLAGRYEGHEPLYLNGHNILPYRTFILSQGSIITGAKINPVYHSEILSRFLHAKDKTLLHFTAREIEYRFRNSTNGIHPFSFTASSGELIGIMGGSGVGKSTFLNVCNGMLPLTSGEILINGHNLSSGEEKLRGIIGFVPQDDLLMEELTVFQNLYFNARLCLNNLTRLQLHRAVLKVLQDIGLNGIRNLKVGDPLNKFISGGQRKRLNIALELIREPSILFVDEPTSGLSSLDSEMVMMLLKEQTLQGRIVVVNIHQPSSDIFKIFDTLLILDKGGYPVYYGNPVEAVTYFKRISHHVNPNESECLSCGYVNPEQILRITEAKTISEYGKQTSGRKMSPETWYNLFRRNIQPQLKLNDEKLPLPPGKFSIPGNFSQWRIFGTRNLLSRITNTQYLLINLLEAPVLAAILAFLIRWHQQDEYRFSANPNLVAYLFMSVVVALFIGMMVSAEEIFRDRKILKREAFLSLNRNSYLFSKVSYLLVLSAIQTLLYVLVGNWILEIKGMTFSYWIILFSTAFFANMVGLNISAGLDSIVAIYILIPFILVPQLLLSGTVVPFDKLNPSIASQERVPFVGNLMTSRWAYEALAVEQFRNNRYEKRFFPFDRKISHYNYLIAFKVPMMELMLGQCRRNLTLNKDIEKASAKMQILRNEFPLVAKESGLDTPSFHSLLTTARFSDSLYKISVAWLDSASRILSGRLGQVSRQRDAVYNALEREHGPEGIQKLREQYHNENLADFVTDRNGMTRIIEGDHKLIRKKDPVFMKPVYRNGNAHFYAPEKILGNWQIQTMWFNLGVIWLFSVLLYLLLAFDGIRKMISLGIRVRK